MASVNTEWKWSTVLWLPFSTRSTGAEGWQLGLARTNCTNVFIVLIAAADQSQRPCRSKRFLKSRELGGGCYFSDDMEHILRPERFGLEAN